MTASLIGQGCCATTTSIDLAGAEQEATADREQIDVADGDHRLHERAQHRQVEADPGDEVQADANAIVIDTGHGVMELEASHAHAGADIGAEARGRDRQVVQGIGADLEERSVLEEVVIEGQADRQRAERE